MSGWASKGNGKRIPERLRQLVLDRDGRLCQLRLARCTTVATQVDHIIERWRGGSDHPSNLRAACAECNADANYASRPKAPSARRATEPPPGLRSL